LLLELKVKDLGIIEDIEWRLDSGLNVVTGETGAGKSLVIDAVELLLVGTSDQEIIRHGATEARIEGVFILSEDNRYSALKSFLKDKGIPSEDETLIINYEIKKQKPGVVRINGHIVTKTILRQAGQLLIDIHGQSDHLSLLDKKNHLDFLDAYAHTLELKKQFGEQVIRFNGQRSELKSLLENQKESARQEEFLQYQINEIKKAKLQVGEDEELEKERHIIAFSEKLKEYSLQVYQTLYEGDSSRFTTSALSRLNEALQSLRKLAELDKSLNSQLDYLEKTIYGLEEVARDVRLYGEQLEHNPGRLDEIEARLELIRNLKRKYGKTIPDTQIYLDKAEKDLAAISTSAEKQAQLESEINALKNELGQLASQLSQARIKAAEHLALNVKCELQELEMSQMQFAVSHNQGTDSEGIPGSDGKCYAFNNTGIDDVEFIVATNPGEPLKPLAKIASTGEISRFTLALKAALSEADQIPVLIFDEIDIGIGGRSGDIIGKKLWALSKYHQVICVTHLPQIAVYADAHFGVRKEVSGERAFSKLENLNSELRLRELALMLAGPGYSDTTYKNVSELMQKAVGWKNQNPGK
jgi:DNA repair protein RecN (Recombination protein N)